MLRDERTRSEWERALGDESFAADPQARWTWWFRRTKYWDETVGLTPVFRVRTVPACRLDPWSGPVGSPGPPGPATVAAQDALE
jgi:hypothetical protein